MIIPDCKPETAVSDTIRGTKYHPCLPGYYQELDHQTKCKKCKSGTTSCGTV